jgi:hypothetical protein
VQITDIPISDSGLLDNPGVAGLGTAHPPVWRRGGGAPMRFLACVSPLGGLGGFEPSSRAAEQPSSRAAEQPRDPPPTRTAVPLPNTRCVWLRLIVRTTGRISRRSPRHLTRWQHLQARTFHVKHVRRGRPVCSEAITDFPAETPMEDSPPSLRTRQAGCTRQYSNLRACYGLQWTRLGAVGRGPNPCWGWRQNTSWRSEANLHSDGPCCLI